MRCIAQGDVLLRVVDKIPENATLSQWSGRIIVTHSETGHHHIIDDAGCVRYEVNDPLVCYLRIDGPHADLVHARPWDTHATIRLLGGGTVYEVRRQREHTPEGWRRVAD